jgi:Probable cobalt transporter subunit (CbtB)
MSEKTAANPSPIAVGLPPVSIRQVLPWLIFAALLLAVGMYFVGAEQGATSLLSGNGVHEWVHDSRHLLGFPCH